MTARLGLGSALRRVADGGEECRVRLRDGTAYDARLGRVGADFVEVVTGELAKTPTGKLQKTPLREAGITTATWDRESIGYVVRR